MIVILRTVVLFMEELKNFLSRMLDDLTAQIDELKSKLDEVNIKIKEDTRFLDMLKEENDKPFSEFSPREYNYVNEEKIEKLDKVIAGELITKDNLDKDIEELQDKIDELVMIIGQVDVLEIENSFTEVSTDNYSENPSSDISKNIPENSISESSINDSENISIEENITDADVIKADSGSTIIDVNSKEIFDKSSSSEDVKSKLDTILSFLPSDPMRARTELQNLRDNL